MQACKSFFKKADIILVVSVAIICLILFLPNFFAQSSSPVAVVYKNGKEIQRIKLNNVSESFELDLDTQPSAVLLIEKGRICYKSSQCHDKLCVKCGWLTKAGDTAACLPSKTLVVIEGMPDTDKPDIISY